MSCRSFSIASLHSMGTFLLACCTGGTEGSNLMVYTPGILPVVSNHWGNTFLKKLHLTHLLQKQGLEKHCFLWAFWQRNGLGRKWNGPEVMENGPGMMGNALVRVVPVVSDGPGK